MIVRAGRHAQGQGGRRSIGARRALLACGLLVVVSASPTAAQVIPPI